MIVYLQNNVVQEIIQSDRTPVEKWYGNKFAEKCIKAPEDVHEGMIYDPQTGTFAEPLLEPPEPIPEPTPEERLETLEKGNTLLKTQIQFQTERADLLEGALIEIASMVIE